MIKHQNLKLVLNSLFYGIKIKSDNGFEVGCTYEGVKSAKLDIGKFIEVQSSNILAKGLNSFL